MAVTKTKNGTFRGEVYYPKEVQNIIGVKGRYKKTFKTLKEAKEDEKQILEKIQRVIQEKIRGYLDKRKY